VPDAGQIHDSISVIPEFSSFSTILNIHVWDVVVQDTHVLARLFAAARKVGWMNQWIDESESESYVMTDSQSASLSWNKAPIWGLRPDIY
jgi:hypothetical protein